MTGHAARQGYLDWVRGLAVVIMVGAHVLDAWTLPGDRTRPLFGYAMVVAGFGAPLFLFLAGVSAVLSAASTLARTGDPGRAWWRVQKRGWQIFGLAFLFRLQSFVLGGGYNAAGLLKVDILNIMGPAIVLTGAIGRLARTTRLQVVLFCLAGAALAFLTPIVRASPLLAPLPDPLEWYLRPTPGRTNFTLLPWAGFVLTGALAGLAVSRLGPVAPRRLQVWMAVAGAALALVSLRASYLPSPYAQSEFWTSSPAFFCLRVGILVSLLPAAWLWTRWPWAGKALSWSPLEVLGRSSLFVYWIHVEMVYGFLSRPIRQRLPLETALLAWLGFTLFLLGLVVLKNRYKMRVL